MQIPSFIITCVIVHKGNIYLEVSIQVLYSEHKVNKCSNYIMDFWGIAMNLSYFCCIVW